MNDSRRGGPLSIGELKESEGFDGFLAETIARHLKQGAVIDETKMKEAIKREVNSGMHRLLDEDQGGA